LGGKAINPIQAAQIMLNAGAKPLEKFTSNRSPWRSQCTSCKREIQPSFANVKNGHSACKYCSRGGVSEKEAILLLKSLNVKPISPYPGFKLPWLSVCLKCKKEIKPRINLISKTKKPCNYCNKRSVDPKDAEKVALTAGAIPLTPYSGPGRWKCKCKTCKRIIFPTLRRMRNGQNPCGWCARVRIDPEEARQVFLNAGLKPIGKYPGVSEPWEAVCTNCGERVSRKLSMLQSGRYACSFCSGRKIKESVAREIMMKAGAKPKAPYPGKDAKWLSECSTCFRDITPKLANVRAGHSPCIYCSGRKVDAGTARDFALSRGLKPLTPYPGATKRWKVNCLKCGRDSTVSWVTLQLRRAGAGCSSCTVFGFKPLEPSYLYIITHEDKKAHKVGIGNTGAKRIEQHLKNGWEIFRVYEFAKGLHAHDIEQTTIEWLRVEKEIGPAFRKGDGWTETVPSSAISLVAIDKKVKELSKNRAKTVKKDYFLN